MRPAFRTAAIAAILFSVTALAHAQAPQGTAAAPAAGSATAPVDSWYRSMYAPDLIGKPVRNSAGTDLAKIEEVAVGPGGSLVAVLQAGGFLGFGGKRAVVPLQELQKADTAFVLPQGSKEKLASRPDYDKGKYPPASHFVQLGTLAK